MENLQDDLFQYGVVAFTEDFSNLLMWSHYADEHRGFVLEIENRPWLTNSKNLVNREYYRYKRRPLCNMEEKAVRVIYRDSQPKFELANDALPDNPWKVHYQKLIKSICLTKGDRWLYEKEHRSILRISHADKIITKYDDYIDDICKDEVEVKMLERGLCEINIEYDHDTGENEDVNGEGIRVGFEVHSKTSTDTLHLFHLNSKLVTGVYFGCNVTDRDIEEIIKIVKNNSAFSKNIKFKKAAISDNRYELIFQDIQF